MRIITIKFSNINNLKGGPWEINFDQDPIQSAGLFAITGPTGSGKSTLLDVITLALFNRIPRFPTSISSPKMEGLGAVLTRNTNHGYAEVEYEVKGNRFTSKWSISRNRNGNLKEYEMSLQEGNGTYMDLKRKEIPSQNEKIIGLNYPQFLKSIILAQGEFSKFIKAGKDERSKLLEQLTGTSIYRKLGIAAFQKHKTVAAQLENEKGKISFVELLDKEKITELEEQIIVAKKEIQIVDQKIKEQAQLLKVKTDLQQQQNSLVQKEKEFTELSTERKTFAPDLERLKIHEKVSPAQSELTRYRDAKVNKEKTEANLLGYQKNLANAKKKSENAIQQLSDITNKKVDRSNFKTIMDQFEKEIIQLDYQINRLKEDGEQQRLAINQLIQKKQLEFSPKIQPEKALTAIQQSQKTLEEQIATSGVKPTRISESEQKVEQNIQELQLLDKFKNNIHLRTENETALQGLQQQSTDLKKQLEQLPPKIESSKESLALLQQNKQLLTKQKEDARTIKSLEEQRVHLTEGEPCPLCGSESHPFADHLPDDASGALEQQLLEATKKIEEKTTALKTIQDSQIRLETELKSIQTQEQQRTQAISDQKKTNLDITKQLTGNLKGMSSEIEVQSEIQKLESTNDALKQGISASRKLEYYERLFRDYHTLRITGQQYKALHAERQSKYPREDITKEVNPLQDQFNVGEGSARDNNKAIEIATEALERAQKMLADNLKVLEPKLKDFGLTSIEELSERILEEKVVEQLRNKQKRLTEQHTTLSTEMNTIIDTIEQLKTKESLPELAISVLSSQLKTQETIKESLARSIGSVETKLQQDKDNRKRVATQKELITKLEAALQKWGLLKELIGDAKGQKFAAFAQAMTLKNLIALANKRLEKLSDRYLLAQPVNDGALNVVDRYQGNAVRAISTLSGGESFMVSLALALSLSDMASRNNPLDSLFIDEGFGSLDQETLGIAIDTLERLQAESSKTVGVISHVEALKERIDVQIQLERDAQGYSTVVVKG